jgi:hypothetical protein
MIGYLYQIGPTLPSAGGFAPITHGEIESWQNNTGIELDAWQSTTLRRLSHEYVSEFVQAADPLRPAPFLTQTTQVDLKQAHDERVRNNLRALAGK